MGRNPLARVLELLIYIRSRNLRKSNRDGEMQMLSKDASQTELKALPGRKKTLFSFDL